MLKKIIDNTLNSKITLLSARPLMGKIALSSEIITKALNNNKKVLIYTLENDCDYFFIHLLSRISDLPIAGIQKYYKPYLGSSKTSKEKIDTSKYIQALEYIQNSQLFINSNVYIDGDVIDYILEFDNLENFDLIIINNLDLLLKKSEYLIDEIMNKLRNTNANILILNGINRNVENGGGKIPTLNDINNYHEVSNYIDNVLSLYMESNNYEFVNIIDYKKDSTTRYKYSKKYDRISDL